MRLIYPGLVLMVIAGSASAQGRWTPQATASPAPPAPVYVAVPPPPSPPGKQRPPRPTGDPGLWVTNDDYPAEALRYDQQGTTGFRVTIDPGGKVVGCEITSPSGFASLDEMTCRVMTQRARFSPALDKKGKPTTGTWASRCRWVLPEPELRAAPEPAVQTISFVIELDGSATECAGSDLGQTPCGRGQVFEPYKDAAGNPVRRRVTMLLSVTVADPNPPPVVPPPVQPKRRKP